MDTPGLWNQINLDSRPRSPVDQLWDFRKITQPISPQVNDNTHSLGLLRGLNED